MQSNATKRLILELVRAPLDAYASVLTILNDAELSEHYGELINVLPYGVRHAVAITVANHLLQKLSVNKITTLPQLALVYGEYLSCLMKQQPDGPQQDDNVSDDDQVLLCKTMLMISTRELKDGESTLTVLDEQFVMLGALRKMLVEGGPDRMNVTIPALIFHCVSLTQKYAAISG